jgi:hypothetical protein
VALERFARNTLVIAGGLSVTMALYHFFLPIHFHWAKFVEEIPAAIRWGLFAINFFFSFLLFVIGVFVLATAWNRSHTQPTALMIVGGGASFWLVNFAYLMISPIPMPPSMYLVKLALQFYSFAALILHGIPLGWMMAKRAWWIESDDSISRTLRRLGRIFKTHRS